MSKLNIQEIESIIRDAIAAYKTPALSIAVIEDGEISYANGFGRLRAAADEKADENTSYAIASISKSTVSASLAMLAELKLLNWEEKVTHYLPDFRLKDEFATREMTVLDLLCHRSGLKSESAGTIWYGSDYTREEVVRRTRFLRPASSFRSTFAYQNVCFLIAGLIIERVSGISWDEFITQNLFKPLGMTRTFPTLAARQAAGIGNLAAPHVMIRGKLTEVPDRSHDNVGPAASCLSTALDMAAYLKLFIHQGRAGSQMLLKPESVAFLHRPQTFSDLPDAYQQMHPRLTPRWPGYALGWNVQDYGGAVRIGHSGGIDGMRSRIEFLPQLGHGAAILTNSDDSRAYSSVLFSLLDRFLGLAPVDWVQEFQKFPLQTDNRPQPESPDGSSELNEISLAGTYRDAAYGDLKVEIENQHPVLRFTHTPAFTADLERVEGNVFRTVWRDRYLEDGWAVFRKAGGEADSKADALHLEQPRLLDVDFDELEEWIPRIAAS